MTILYKTMVDKDDKYDENKQTNGCMIKKKNYYYYDDVDGQNQINSFITNNT